jgi:rod shape-determining protein MreC
VVLISAQVNTPSGVRLIEALTFSTFSEVERLSAGMFDAARNAWAGYFALSATHAENERLKQENLRLHVRLQEQRALAERSARLQALLDLKTGAGLPTIAASVISAEATPWFRTVTIDRGADDGLRKDMAVIAAQGIVGRVVGEVAPRAARVQLLIDRSAAAGALVERSRAAGVVVGGGGDVPLQMEYVSNQADVKVGDTVVASGLDGIFPKGFVIGRVEVAQTTGSGSRIIRVSPAVDFSALEDVLVVLSDPAGQLRSEDE